jgi:hypothetical protein
VIPSRCARAQRPDFSLSNRLAFASRFFHRPSTAAARRAEAAHRPLARLSSIVSANCVLILQSYLQDHAISAQPKGAIMMERKFYLAVLGVLLATAIGGACAAQSAENDALAIAGAKIGMAQAVTAAEEYVGGKASRAEYERHKALWVFDVEVVKDKKVVDVKVDPISGKVIATEEDKIDQDDDQDHAD